MLSGKNLIYKNYKKIWRVFGLTVALIVEGENASKKFNKLPSLQPMSRTSALSSLVMAAAASAIFVRWSRIVRFVPDRYH